MDVSDGVSTRIKPTTADTGHKTNPAVSPWGAKLQEAAKVAHINHADNFSALFDLTCLWML
jgi:hypothetical protein